MIRLHHVPQSRSMRSLWLLHELGVDFEVEIYALDKTLRQEPYSTLNPAGRVPTLELDGLVVRESGAIAQVLCERFSPEGLGRPMDHPERAAWLDWIHFAETVSVHCANLSQQHIFLREDWMRSPTIMKLEAARLGRLYAMIDAALGGRESLLESGFTAADIGVGQAVYLGRHFTPTKGFADLERWIDAITARPAFAASLAGGPGIYDRDFYPAMTHVPPPPEDA